MNTMTSISENEDSYITKIRSEVSLTPKRGFRISTTEDMVAEKYIPKPHFGAHGEEEIPVLIPNTAVKLLSGDYTATSGKLARCRIIEIAIRIGWLFSLLNIILNMCDYLTCHLRVNRLTQVMPVEVRAE